uniref:Thioredoxin-related transmembrane protein 1-like n=1 Tax=Ciona intestinalis TaxID=7719 RepID=H2Y3G2_CIOIN
MLLLPSVSFILCITFALPLNAKKSQLITLTDSNWKECLTGEWMIKFYAPWCPACRDNEPQYSEFSEWSDDLGIKVATVDITKQLGLSGRFMVTALPSFYHTRSAIDGEFRRYNGERSADTMHEFIEGKLWKDHETVYWLRHPNSFGMTLMSWLFKTSVIMKNIHESLTEDYGLSLWMSYAVFGVGTIITGLFLGFILVCIVDFVSPPPPPPKKSTTVTQQKTAEPPVDDKNDKGGEGENKASLEEDSEKDSQASDWETINEAEIDPGSQGSQPRQRKIAASQLKEEDKKESEKVGGKGEKDD